MSIRNRELSQFGSFVAIDDASQKISITNSSSPYVGIGTTNPQEKLDVLGNVKISGDLTVDGNFDYDFTGANFEGDININTTGIVTASSFVNDEGVLAVTDRWDKTGTTVYKLDGNVAIGLTNPTERLEVFGNISASRFISTITTGTSPFQVNSTTEVTNLNASLLRGGVPGQNINSNDIVTLGASQTLTNKTLTLPTFGGTGVAFNGSSSQTTTVKAAATAGNNTLNLPTTSGNLVCTGDTGVITSNMITDLNITNADVSTSAGIAYSKLNLNNSITNNDLAGGIANAKLTNSTISGVSLGNSLFTLTRGTYLTGSNYNGSAVATWAVDATSTNTADKVVVRDSSGNFSANTITLANNLTASSGTITCNTSTVGNGGLSVSGIATVTGVTLFAKQVNVSGITTVVNTTSSTSTTTGALVVSGGAGVAGNAYIGGLVRNTNTTNSTSTSTGALVVSGGAGFNNDVYIGGLVRNTNTTSSTSTSSGALVVSGGAGIAGNAYIGGLIRNTSTTNSTSTSSGALVVSGGAGFNNDVYIGGLLNVTSSITSNSGFVGTATVGSTLELLRGNMASNDQFRILIGGSSDAGYVEIATADNGTEPIYVRQYSGAFSSLTRTATLLDESGNTTFPGTLTTPVVQGSTANSGTLTVKSTSNATKATAGVLFDDNITSSSTTTGTVVVTGGVGISEDLYIGGNLVGEFQVLHVQDQKSSGVDGGTFSNGAWRTRTLNTVVTNTISGASVASNQITLPAGTYEIEAYAPAYNVLRHQARIQSISGSSTTIYGTSEVVDNTTGVNITSHSKIRGRVVGAVTFEIQHQCSTSRTTVGFGFATGFAGSTEVYTDVYIRKIS